MRIIGNSEANQGTMTKRRLMTGCAIVAIAAIGTAAIVAARRGTPGLPAAAHYANLPAQFDGALESARAKVVAGGYVSEDVRGLARLYEANGLTDEAVVCYRILNRRDGLTAQDHYYLADMLAYRGDLAAAEVELRAALKAEPGYLPAHLILGDVLFKSGRPEEAKAEYEATIARYPDQPQAMFGLARIDLQNGNDDAAVATLSALLTKHPEMTSGAGLLAQVLDRRGDTARAGVLRLWSRQKPEPIPEDPWMDALLLDCFDLQRLGLKFEEYHSSGQIALALPLLRRIEELDPKSPIPPLLRGWSQIQNHNDAGAVDEYREALSRGGDPEKICPYLAQALLNLGRVSDAAKLLAEYNEKKPGSIPILTAYADVAMREKDRPLATALLEQVVEKEPFLISADMTLASLRWAAGERDEAARCLERVTQVAPGDVPSRALLAEYYLGRKQPESAVPMLEQALTSETTDTAARRNLAQMLFAAYLAAGNDQEEKGEGAGAVANFYEKAIRLAPANPGGYAAKAAACARLGMLGDAAAALRKLAELQPANPTVFLSLGDVLYRQGDRGGATLNWRRARELTRADDTALMQALGSRLNGPITEATFQ